MKPASFRRIAPLLLSLPAVGLAQQIAIGRYLLPTDNGYPYSIAAGPDGALWFTELDGNKIGRITTAGTVTEYPVPTTNSAPWGITSGPDGALWFTEELGNKIGRITTAGSISEYPVPTANSQPYGITAGPDGALWFTEYSVPEGEGGNQIGRITVTGSPVTEYPVPTADSGAYAITAGPDGALWFAELYGNRIGRITTVGIVTEYPLATGYGPPFAITTGPDGALWFTQGIGAVARITTAGSVTQYPAPYPSASFTMYGITTGPDGELWASDGVANQIGEIVSVTANLSVSPTSGFYRSNLTFKGSMFAPNENVQIYTIGVGSAVLASATADASGSFTTSARDPQEPFSNYGPSLFLGVGESDGKLGAATFFPMPKLTLSPDSGPVGATVTAQGYGFGPLQPVQVYWNNPRTLLGSVMADINGTFGGSMALTFTIPTGAPAGTNGAIGVGKTTDAKGHGSFTVQ
jgi:streptogramin lyase